MMSDDKLVLIRPPEGLQDWLARAARCELLSLMFSVPTRDVAARLVSGELGEACVEVASLNGIDDEVSADVSGCLDRYVGQDADACFHAMRREYTRLFVGAGDAPVTPYAGVWAARQHGRRGLLFVGGESMAVERVVRRCGFCRTVGAANEPLDHIGSLLGFAALLCLVRAGAIPVPQDGRIEPGEYERFCEEHLGPFASALATEVLGLAPEPFTRASAYLLAGFVGHAPLDACKTERP